MTLSLRDGDNLPEPLWAYDDFASLDQRSVGAPTGGLASLGYIKAALRRTTRVWISIAVLGLLAGLAAYKEVPPAYKATSEVLLASSAETVSGQAILDAEAFAQSNQVAAAALRKMGLPSSDPGSFTGDYTATELTNRVLLITSKAKSSALAVQEANAVAGAFLSFQDQLLRTQQQQVTAALQQQIAQAKQRISVLTKQIKALSARPPTPALETRIVGLKTDRNQAQSQLTIQEATNNASLASTEIATKSQIIGTKLLDAAAPVARSKHKYLILYSIIGLFAGLVLSMGVIVVRALVSDRLRRRDDVSRALGAPVRLSVPRLRLGRGRPALGAAENPDIQRIVGLLDRSIQPSSRGLASLAVVPVDDTNVPALCVAALAVSCARRGLQVMVADLGRGAPVAALLGLAEPGVRVTDADGTRLIVMVPDPEDLMPAGPLPQGGRRREVSESVAEASGAADLLITLASLDPALGADHLSGWAGAAVAMATAGQPSAARVQAVGEMIRLSGTTLMTGVLIGADKADQSLGITGATATADHLADHALGQ